MLSQSERSALRRFHQFLMTPGQMLCFFGPDLKKHGRAFQNLTEKNLLSKEQFAGAYSLTETGFQALDLIRREE